MEMENRSLRRMTWKTVRLELARTRDFPNGSAGRAYLLRLPINEQGLLDEEKYAEHPEHATVRRYWPNEPDRNGYLIRKRDGWTFSFDTDENDDEPRLQIGSKAIRLGESITIKEADGTRLPFRVAFCDS